VQAHRLDSSLRASSPSQAAAPHLFRGESPFRVDTSQLSFIDLFVSSTIPIPPPLAVILLGSSFDLLRQSRNNLQGFQHGEYGTALKAAETQKPLTCFPNMVQPADLPGVVTVA
jgi:hypothetical protein